MDLLHLETFSRLVQQRNFSRVAKDMGVSQPTVTIRIKTLEEALGVALIVRMGHKVSVTPAGQIYYEHIERSMRVLREGIDLIKGSTGNIRRRLSMAGAPTVSTFILPSLLREFYQVFNDCEISLEMCYTSEVIEMIVDEVAQVGFISGDFNHPTIMRTPIYKDQFYMVAHPSHALANKLKVNISDLSSEPLITYQKDNSMSYRIENLFREIGLKSKVAMELNNSDSIKRMVLEGNGIAFLPWISIQKEVTKGKLTILPLQLPGPLEREISVIYHKKNRNLTQVENFLFILEKYISKNRFINQV
jgi:DNA-binding transcriptional LysR family regulator